MKVLNKIILIFFLFISFETKSFPIPEGGKVVFDIIRKSKVIGSHEISFTNDNNQLIVETSIEIEVKRFMITFYDFSHLSKEVWEEGKLVSLEAYTDFEDEREYFIKGNINNDLFIGSGMDGEIESSSNIIPSNFWNIEVMKQSEIFDTQKGIIRKLEVKENGIEKIEYKNQMIDCKKFLLNASSNPKDKGPFPEYTLWYNQGNDELLKFKFRNWKDNKIITIIRKD